MDAEVGRLFTALKEQRPDLLMVVADHGEGLDLPAHHGNGHGRYLYASAVHIPLLLHPPGLPAGHVVDGLSMNVDVAPTLLDLLGVPVPEVYDGKSLADAARGETQTGRAHDTAAQHALVAELVAWEAAVAAAAEPSAPVGGALEEETRSQLEAMGYLE